MILRSADHLPRPVPTDADQLFRLAHHDVLTCCLPDATLARGMNPKVKLLDYINAKRDPWTESIVSKYSPALRDLPFACKAWLNETGYDGLILDEPFMSPEGPRLCCDIATAIAPRIACPNFGDFWTWSKGGYGPVQSLAQLTRWHFCQVMADTTTITREAWQGNVIPAIKRRLDHGKTIIAGIYDPDGHNPELAALLTTTIEHPSLYWHYATAVPPEVGDARTQWNPWWSVWR